MKRTILLLLSTALLLAALCLCVGAAEAGAFTLEGNTGADNCKYDAGLGVLEICGSKPITVSNTVLTQTTDQRIRITAANADVTLRGVNISIADDPALTVEEQASAILRFEGENRLISVGECAVIELRDETKTVTVTGGGSLYLSGQRALGSLTAGVDLYISQINMTAIGGVGGKEGSPAQIVIQPDASVKGGVVNTKTIDADYLRTMPVEIRNENGEAVAIDGVTVREPGDTSPYYAYLSIGTHAVTVGGTTEQQPVKDAYGLTVLGDAVPGTDYRYDGDGLTFLRSGVYQIGSVWLNSTDRIAIACTTDEPTELCFSSVSIKRKTPILITEDCACDVTLTFAGDNLLAATEGAGIQKDNTDGSLTICDDGNARLTVTGGNGGAGIGGGDGGSVKNITILTYGGMTMDVTGGYGGAGIGGGNGGSAEKISVSGVSGTVKGGAGAAGIGGGLGKGGAELAVYDVDLEVCGGENRYHEDIGGAGIGGGNGGGARDIEISGITGGKKLTAKGGILAAGIGSGKNGGLAEDIEILNADVDAFAGAHTGGVGGAAGIGGGAFSNAKNITIEGGHIYAEGAEYGSCIGSTGGDTWCDTVTIRSAEVRCYLMYDDRASGIGCGESGTADDIQIIDSVVLTDGYFDGRNCLAIGSLNADGEKIYVKNSYVGGSLGAKEGSIVIDPHSVVMGNTSSTPKDSEGRALYPLRVEDILGRKITVDDYEYPYSGEQLSQYYLPGVDHVITVGGEQKTYHFDTETMKFPVYHDPAAVSRRPTPPTCEEDGSTGSLQCRICGTVEYSETVPRLGHSGSMTVKREATLSSDGEVECHCDVCGKTYTAVSRLYGDIVVSGILSDDDVTYDPGTKELHISTPDQLCLENYVKNSTSDMHITVEPNQNNRLVLAGLCLDLSGAGGYAPVEIPDGSPHSSTYLTLAEGTSSSLTAGQYCAAIHKVGSSKALVIDGSGTLTAIGGELAAGIGGQREEAAGNIRLHSGTVTAEGGLYGAGIGGSWNGTVRDITILGGTVTARGGGSAAGIGSGFLSDAVQKNVATGISLLGGVITAESGGADAVGGGVYAYGTTAPVAPTTISAAVSVKTVSGAAASPENPEGLPVTLHTIEIPAGERLFINGKGFPYTGHQSENKVYLYLSANDRYEVTGQPEARVGETDYAAFADAVAAARSGDTVKLLKDVDVTTAVTVPNGVTVDCGTYGVFVSGDGKYTVGGRTYQVPRGETGAFLCAAALIPDWSLRLESALRMNFYGPVGSYIRMDGEKFEGDSEGFIPTRFYNAKNMVDEGSVSLIQPGATPAVSATSAVSIRKYAESVLKDLAWETDAVLGRLMEAMLDYGTEAQKYFGYKKDTPANGSITEHHLPDLPARTNGQTIIGDRTLFYGTSCVLGSNMNMKFYFRPKDTAVTSFTVEYDDYLGVHHSIPAEPADAGNGYVAYTLTTLVAADIDTVITATLTTADSRTVTVTDSISSYLERVKVSNPECVDIAEKMLQFGVMAKDYFLDAGDGLLTDDETPIG